MPMCTIWKIIILLVYSLITKENGYIGRQGGGNKGRVDSGLIKTQETTIPTPNASRMI